MTPKLLALDLSGHVGHGVLQRGCAPLLGTLRLRGDRAKQLGEFLTWGNDMHQVHRFDGIAWERPLLKPTDKVDVLELLYGLVGIAYALAGTWCVPYREVDVKQVKITLTGKANADKDEMVAAAMQHMNWKVATHHEADAGGVGVWAYEQLWPKARAAA